MSSTRSTSTRGGHARTWRTRTTPARSSKSGSPHRSPASSDGCAASSNSSPRNPSPTTWWSPGTRAYGVRNILRGQTYIQKPRWTYTRPQPGEHPGLPSSGGGCAASSSSSPRNPSPTTWWSPGTRSYGVRNILRGQTYIQKPRWTYTAPEPGEYRCFLWLGTGRPRPSGKKTSSNILKVGWKSHLEATEPLNPASAQSFDPNVPSRRLIKGKAADENVLTWTAPASVTSFSASGDTYLTTCTAVSGSTDPVTGKRLCEGYAK